MERNADGFVPAPKSGRLVVDWRHRLETFALTALALFFLLWDLLLLMFAFAGMPQNDFGRPLWSVLAFLGGKDMYGLNEAVIYRYRPDTVIHLWNLNPPHSHFLYLPFAALPPSTALLTWYVLGGFCLYGSIRIILSEAGIELTDRGREWFVIWLLSFSGMGVAMSTGHMSFPLMLMITLAWRNARHGRWGKAGCWLGLALSMKPFLMIFIPYLIAKRRWRGVAAVGLTTGLAYAMGLLVFGTDNHHSWLRALSRADSWAWLPLNASLYGTLSRLLMKNPSFTPVVELDPGQVRAAWLALGIPAGLVAVLRTVTDSSSRGTDRAFAILLVSALLLSPLGWVYYFWLPVGPIAVLARDWWIGRSRPVGHGSRARRSPSWYLFLASMIGMISPAIFATAMQPSALATLLIAGIPFWSLLFLWLALVLDGLDLGPARVRSDLQARTSLTTVPETSVRR